MVQDKEKTNNTFLPLNVQSAKQIIGENVLQTEHFWYNCTQKCNWEEDGNTDKTIDLEIASRIVGWDF